tara:strand:+ start:536 stop:1420 length:885 start_codon:yes stop_codon:yes gene_type:complete
MDDAFNKLIEERNIKNENTKTSYRYTYQSASDKFGGYDVWNRENKKILGQIRHFEIPTTAKYHLINVVIMFKKLYKRESEVLSRYRNELNLEIQSETKTRLDNMELPDYETYFGSIDKETNKRKYIINKVIQLFGFRNLDLMLSLQKMKRGQRPNLKDNINKMVIQKKDVVLHILNYKTSATYGYKKLIIKKDKYPLLVKTINEYYNEGFMYLLSKKNKEEIKKNALHRYILLNTNNVGTSSLFKMSVKYFRERGDLNRLKELSDSRGTSLDTICSNYNIQNENKVELKGKCYI